VTAPSLYGSPLQEPYSSDVTTPKWAPIYEGDARAPEGCNRNLRGLKTENTIRSFGLRCMTAIESMNKIIELP